MRSAPSRRIVSPLSIGLSTMWRRARRTPRAGRGASGTGSPAPSACARSSGSAASIGVSKMPGRDRHHADAARRQVARGRQRHADDAALRRRVGDLADLPVEGGDRRGVDEDAALAVLVGLVGAIAAAARRSTLKVPIRLIEITLVNISRLCGPPLWATRSAQPTPAQQTEIRRPPSAPAARSTAAATGSASVTSASTNSARSPSSAASASPFSALRSAIVTRRRPRAARARSPRRAPRRRRRPVRCSLDPHRREARTIHSAVHRAP